MFLKIFPNFIFNPMSARSETKADGKIFLFPVMMTPMSGLLARKFQNEIFFWVRVFRKTAFFVLKPPNADFSEFPKTGFAWFRPTNNARKVRFFSVGWFPNSVRPLQKVSGLFIFFYTSDPIFTPQIRRLGLNRASSHMKRDRV